MTVLLRSWNRRGRAMGLAARFGLLCAALPATFASAQAQKAQSGEAPATTVTPYTLFEYATLTGSGNEITATWLPVVNSAGKTIYQNITLLFDVDAEGNLTIAAGYPKAIQTPPPLITSFIAGKYVAPSTLMEGKGIINVSGPSVAAGGATEWSLSAGSGAYQYTYPQIATWYVGPLGSSPIAARLKAAGITSTAWSYGVGGGCDCGLGDGAWYFSNNLLGFSQTGNVLTIVSFTDISGNDHNSPQSVVPFTLQAP